MAVMKMGNKRFCVFKKSMYCHAQMLAEFQRVPLLLEKS